MGTRQLGRLVTELLGLVLPQECAGCGAWDRAVCPTCRALLAGCPVRCEEAAAALGGADGGPSPFPVWRVTEYAGPVRGLVVSWKRGGRAEVARAVLEAGRRAGQAWADELALRLPRDGQVRLVPAPSGWRRRAAGRFVVGDLARAVAAGLAAAPAGPGVVVSDALRRGAGRAHQAGLGAAGRVVNRRRGVRLAGPLPSRATCVLVDDVLTTGATLAAAGGALEAAGHRVAGALVLAATPPPRGRG